MMIDTLKTLFTRDLNRLKSEIEHYQKEENLWKLDGSIANSAGNLCLHLLGNINTYIGKEIGNIHYIRNRELEFVLKDVPKADLLKKIDDTIDVVNKSLDKLSENALLDEYPILVFDQKTSTQHLLIHLASHLSYHLGQINYHRRLLDT
jgi:uncharacterized damage-inducible protein DinB